MLESFETVRIHTTGGASLHVRERALQCGHFLQEEAPDEVLTELRALLG